MDEKQILDIGAMCPIAASTSYRAHRLKSEDETLQLDLVNFIAPFRDAAMPVTSAPDQPTTPKL